MSALNPKKPRTKQEMLDSIYEGTGILGRPRKSDNNSLTIEERVQRSEEEKTRKLTGEEETHVIRRPGEEDETRVLGNEAPNDGHTVAYQYYDDNIDKFWWNFYINSGMQSLVRRGINRTLKSGKNSNTPKITWSECLEYDHKDKTFVLVTKSGLSWFFGLIMDSHNIKGYTYNSLFLLWSYMIVAVLGIVGIVIVSGAGLFGSGTLITMFIGALLTAGLWTLVLGVLRECYRVYPFPRGEQYAGERACVHAELMSLMNKHEGLVKSRNKHIEDHGREGYPEALNKIETRIFSIEKTMDIIKEELKN